MQDQKDQKDQSTNPKMKATLKTFDARIVNVDEAS